MSLYINFKLYKFLILEKDRIVEKIKYTDIKILNIIYLNLVMSLFSSLILDDDDKMNATKFSDKDSIFFCCFLYDFIYFNLIFHVDFFFLMNS